jgi:hypothetical protein
MFSPHLDNQAPNHYLRSLEVFPVKYLSYSLRCAVASDAYHSPKNHSSSGREARLGINLKIVEAATGLFHQNPFFPK